jgi:DNA polymerase III subunit delta'
MQFKNIIGQEDIKRMLKKAVDEDRIPHASLLYGPPGNGKLALALAFAQYINCHSKSNGDSCGICNSCRKYAKLIHPDLHFTYPVIKANDKATSVDYIAKWREYFSVNPYPKYQRWMQCIADENKQGAIYVDEARDLIHKLNQKSYEADYKISIIWLPEFMNPQCANKMLKILEEPPVNTLFILVSEGEEKLLNTIRSRCQFIRVPVISESDMQQYLGTISLPEHLSPSSVAHLAQGNLNTALDIIEKDQEHAFNYKQFAIMMRAGYARKIQDILTWSEEMGNIGRVKQMGFLMYCNRFLRENFLQNFKEPELVYMDDHEREFSKKFSPFINEKNVIYLYKEFDKSYRDVSMNGNGKLIFMDLGLRVSRLIRAK